MFPCGIQCVCTLAFMLGGPSTGALLIQAQSITKLINGQCWFVKSATNLDLNVAQLLPCIQLIEAEQYHC